MHIGSLKLLLASILVAVATAVPAWADATKGEMFGYRIGDTHPLNEPATYFLKNIWTRANAPVLPEGFGRLDLNVTGKTHTITGMEAKAAFGAIKDADAFAERVVIALTSKFGNSDDLYLLRSKAEGQEFVTGPRYLKGLPGGYVIQANLYPRDYDRKDAAAQHTVTISYWTAPLNPKHDYYAKLREAEFDQMVEEYKRGVVEKEKDGVLRGIK